METIALNLLDIMKTANGKDMSGAPNAIASLHVDEINQPVHSRQDIKHIAEVLLKEAVIDIFVSDGCAVVRADFPFHSRFEFNRAQKTAKDWLKDNKKNQFLTLSVIPLPLHGQIYLLFDQLVYADGYSLQKGFRLILCFDNQDTQAFETEDIDYSQVTADVEAEIRRQEETLDLEIEQLEKEQKKYENSFAQEVEQQSDFKRYVTDQGKETDEDELFGMRYTEEE